MVTSDGRPKGMRIVLEERGVDTSRMKAPDMRLVLRSHADFKNEKTAVESLVQEKGQRAIYLPKFHCELNPIERVWGEAKRFTRSHCDYSFAGLERTIVPALESVRLDTIRKYFRKCREYMQAYREGNAGGSDVEKGVQKYKSTGVYLAMLSNHLFLFVLLYLENLLCIFITILNVLLQQISVVYHTSP